MPKQGRPIVVHRDLQTTEGAIPAGSPGWFAWLAQQEAFTYQGEHGHFTAQRELRRQKPFWYAYRRRGGKLFKQYLGKPEELTADRLEQASLALAGHKRLEPPAGQPGEARIDTSLLAMTKVNTPALPVHLLTRPRLLCQINNPLTIISAPSGFGKSTLLNDWKRSCGFPVAWLALDKNDNHPTRFWYSLTLALRAIRPDFGDGLLGDLRMASSRHLPALIARLTNEFLRDLAGWPRFGLVIDDFQHITDAGILNALQAWLERIPPNMQLAILGHSRPALALGHLRARGLVSELEAGDLRFTLAEGVSYLRLVPQQAPLALTDLERLVKHTEGWAAGLTLAAIALSKQEAPHDFIATFSGAHLYLREYFMETVLQRSSAEVQAFLLQTAILRHLTGSLCDAVTGQNGGAEMLARLWQENLFIDRLSEPGAIGGWYRYHDLFAEMLRSQLAAHDLEQVARCHQRAAQWYRAQNAPADAVYHLLAIDAWEEAAALIESMALQELEQYGEDSRLLRWLQELPEDVVQRHKTLLFVYLRLAEVALPRQKIERFLERIETNLARKTAHQQTPDEREVLAEIGRLRQAWQQGDLFTPSARDSSQNDARWEVLNGLHLLRQELAANPVEWESRLEDLLVQARAQGNLFVILMVGGLLARLAYVKGHLRRSEKISRQILEQAGSQRGKLPEPASIALAVLSQVHFERYELETAQRYLVQAQEVDPNPTSSNMPVQFAILWARIQTAQGRFDEALATMRAARELHARRPSGMWTDQDLIAFEALTQLRKGDANAAQHLLDESDTGEEHALSRLARAEVWLASGRPADAEELLAQLAAQYPNGIFYEPLLGTRVLQALAAFAQNQNHLALQTISDALRLAAPERFYRPFLENSPTCSPLLLLARNSEKLSNEATAFLDEILRRTGQARAVSPAEIAALSTAASISQREQEILRLLAEGCTNRAIAGKLSISESTVKTHLSNIYAKLGVNTRLQAVQSAKELDLLKKNSIMHIDMYKR